MKSSTAQKIVLEYGIQLRHKLGAEVRGIYLFGSHARNEATAGSDMDVLVVVKDPFQYRSIHSSTAPISAELSLKYDALISTVIIGSNEWLAKKTPLTRSAQLDAIPEHA